MDQSDPRRRACSELAELLSTPEGLRTARLLQLTEALEPRRAPAPDATGETAVTVGGAPGGRPASPRPISVWRPRRHGGELVFERPPPHPLGDHHAQRLRLRAVKPHGTTRICFFGESVAAGYLYAPRLTPAGVLERRLCATAGGGAYEVVDLARTNETLDSMLRTLESSLQLSPDLLVIFAGNNWNLLETPGVSPYVPSVRARQRAALALRRNRLAGLAELAGRELAAKAETTLARVAELAGRDATPVLVVVPEVNLEHWQDRQPVSWLPGDGSRRWHALYAEAASRLKAGRPEAALKAADAMLELDRGLCPTGHRLRAEALVSLGRLGEARRACEAEVESGRYATLCFLSAPRAAPSVARLLRRAAARHGFAVVDLPRLFAGHETGASSLPGRRLFLDYCHLSAEGIELAMAAVAGKVLERRGESPVEIARAGPGAEPAAEALARLGAAVHGSHRLLTNGDKRAYLERWCREALVADPKIVGALRDLLGARVAPSPAILTAALERNLASHHRLLLQHGWRWHHLDVELIEAMCAALEAAGHAVRDEVEASLLRHHGVGPEGVDLSRPPYLWEPLERFYPEAMAPRGMTGRATYRSPWPESSFCLIAGGECDIELELIARLPAIAGAPEAHRGEIGARLNGRDIASVAAGESWSRHPIRLPRRDLRPAINRLTLVWPALPPYGDQALEHAIRRLENGVEADLHPVFGEVFSLVARTSCEAPKAQGGRAQRDRPQPPSPASSGR